MLSHLNNLLAEDTGGDRFMTMLLMTVDARLKEMRWASAGHEAPLVYDAIADKFISLKCSSIALGIQKGIRYTEQVFSDVKSGQIYIALTDGLVETFNEKGQMFGKERLMSLFRQSANLSEDSLRIKIEDELNRFRDGSSVDIDYTFVIVKVK
jgi:serine phosphatase RsbU (regulator of sigma subunit)